MLIGSNPHKQHIRFEPSMGNRHGLIAGATGTGKTITLQILAEEFSRIGVPVFTADIKGDLSGLAKAASPHKKIDERINTIGITDYQPQAFPVRFWDIYGENGHFIRTTITDMGATLLSNLLDLTESQSSILHIIFSYSDEQNLPLLDMKDLKEVLLHVQDHRRDIEKTYGRISSRSLSTLQRKLLVLKESGGEHFFGEPALDIHSFMQTQDGLGVINLLDGQKLMLQPKIYATFLLWLLTELFEQLEEAGDSDKPKLVFFFDEAHLLFDNAPKALLQRIEQIARLIRSKGVGIYFVTQSPSDIPDDVLGQLGNRVQHALRAFTPKDQKTVRSAAQTFRQNPEFDTEEIITQLGVGEALVSVLDVDGIPTIVEQAHICPPRSQIGPITRNERELLLENSVMSEQYDEAIDRESAYEILQQRKATLKENNIEKLDTQERVESTKKSKTRKKQGILETFLKQMMRTLASSLSRKMIKRLFK
jgi:DNA helicase HerA-like ATPase